MGKYSYYAVRIGRQPGVYHTWDECKAQTDGFSNPVFKGFKRRQEAFDFISAEDADSDFNSMPTEIPYYAVARGHKTGVYSEWTELKKAIDGFEGALYNVFENKVEAEEYVRNNGSYFQPSHNFTPDSNAPIVEEFDRLASSQGIIHGSQHYYTERTKALAHEMKWQYFPSSQPIGEGGTGKECRKTGADNTELTDEDKLRGYQNLCREVGKTPGDTIEECQQTVKHTLVNIIDFIDARRIGCKPEVWEEPLEFMRYTLRDEKRMSLAVAKEDWLLSSLLQNFNGKRYKNGEDAEPGRLSSRIRSGRVKKRKAARVSRPSKSAHRALSSGKQYLGA